MINVRRLACVAVVFALLLSWSDGMAYAQWSQFRGPNGSGVGAGAGYPVSFSPTSNVIWKSAIPFGQSSPVLAGNHLYVTASVGDQLVTICLDATTGRELWRRQLKRARTQKVYKANDPASPTPAADDQGVVAFFPEYGLVAYTADGKDRWTMPLGPFNSFYGMSASPVLADGLVVLLCDQRSGSFIVALDRATGRSRWTQERVGAVEGWATPMVFRPAAGGVQLIVPGTTRIDSYTLSDGKPRWWMPQGSGGSMGTAVASGDTLFFSTTGSMEPSMPAFDSYLAKYDKDKDGRLSLQEFSADKEMGEHFGWGDADKDNFLTVAEWNTIRNLGVGDFGAIAVRPGDAVGKLDGSAVLWRFKKNLPYIPAPLLYQDVVYLVKDGGIVTSLAAKTGEALKTGRSGNALGEYFASPVAADGKVFLANVEGKVTVLKAGAQWDVLGTNDLGEEIHATPALSGGRIYIRTKGSVYCFGLK